MSALDAWKARSTFEVDLPSGVHVKGKFLDMETALMAGGFDFSVLEGIDVDKKVSEVPEEEVTGVVAEGYKYKRFVVCSCVLEVDGETVQLTDEDYSLIPEDDRDRIYKLASRSELPLVVEA